MRVVPPPAAAAAGPRHGYPPAPGIRLGLGHPLPLPPAKTAAAATPPPRPPPIRASPSTPPPVNGWRARPLPTASRGRGPRPSPHAPHHVVRLVPSSPSPSPSSPPSSAALAECHPLSRRAVTPPRLDRAFLTRHTGVSALDAVQVLDCADCGLTAVDSAALQACAQLRIVRASENRLGLAMLAPAPRLEDVRLAACQLRAATWVAPPPAAFAHLMRLDLSYNPFGPGAAAVLADLAWLPALRELSLNACGLRVWPDARTDPALAARHALVAATAAAAAPPSGAAWAMLDTLDLQDNRLTDASLPALGQLGRLRRLSLRRNRLTSLAPLAPTVPSAAATPARAARRRTMSAFLTGDDADSTLDLEASDDDDAEGAAEAGRRAPPHEPEPEPEPASRPPSRFLALTHLDVAQNPIAQAADLVPLVQLPSLATVSLEGIPAMREILDAQETPFVYRVAGAAGAVAAGAAAAAATRPVPDLFSLCMQARIRVVDAIYARYNAAPTTRLVTLHGPAQTVRTVQVVDPLHQGPLARLGLARRARRSRAKGAAAASGPLNPATTAATAEQSGPAEAVAAAPGTAAGVTAIPVARQDGVFLTQLAAPLLGSLGSRMDLQPHTAARSAADLVYEDDVARGFSVPIHELDARAAPSDPHDSAQRFNAYFLRVIDHVLAGQLQDSYDGFPSLDFGDADDALQASPRTSTAHEPPPPPRSGQRPTTGHAATLAALEALDLEGGVDPHLPVNMGDAYKALRLAVDHPKSYMRQNINRLVISSTKFKERAQQAKARYNVPLKVWHDDQRHRRPTLFQLPTGKQGDAKTTPSTSHPAARTPQGPPLARHRLANEPTAHVAAPPSDPLLAADWAGLDQRLGLLHVHLGALDQQPRAWGPALQDAQRLLAEVQSTYARIANAYAEEAREAVALGVGPGAARGGRVGPRPARKDPLAVAQATAALRQTEDAAQRAERHRREAAMEAEVAALDAESALAGSDGDGDGDMESDAESDADGVEDGDGDLTDAPEGDLSPEGSNRSNSARSDTISDTGPLGDAAPSYRRSVPRSMHNGDTIRVPLRDNS
ncbi:hypothetical protein CXG81DRAFT_17391 [Caulochytrium protostelioides]|uniref:Uncharacterized protein n=1 Tax=Caulochytrium protostelioides TaxID=1555241 RepID=A0A4P9XC68_9FUNG|nr:hypothetical protein CXG81DRAFT_17391 [Caulochytrium protostelioides]|eukprot:RKP03037.1 hypothetical protein CXG81DRAFT_17391 [Caulochytrium protostelioides]